MGDSSDSNKDKQYFGDLHRGLTVEMIATPRAEIKKCSMDEAVLDVISRIPKSECYDYLPVTDRKEGEQDRIIGVFHAKPFYCRTALRTDIVGRDRICALSEDQLIGASTSILDFVKEGHEKPWRLVVSDAGITGLVTLVDLQRPAARVALFSLIATFESCMIDVIRSIFSEKKCWLSLLSSGRREMIRCEIRKSHDDDGHVEDLLFTRFCDKRDIIMGRIDDFDIAESKREFEERMKRIERLRDKLVHANDYASTQTTARDVSTVVRYLLNYMTCFRKYVD